MADPRGFLTITERELPAYRPVEVRILDYAEVEDRRSQESATMGSPAFFQASSPPSRA